MEQKFMGMCHSILRPFLSQWLKRWNGSLHRPLPKNGSRSVKFGGVLTSFGSFLGLGCGSRLGCNALPTIHFILESTYVWVGRVFLNTLAIAQVTILGKCITRDSVKDNSLVLEPAIRLLGLRVSVQTCNVHIAELYNFMGIQCPSDLTICTSLWYIIESYRILYFGCWMHQVLA